MFLPGGGGSASCETDSQCFYRRSSKRVQTPLNTIVFVRVLLWRNPGNELEDQQLREIYTRGAPPRLLSARLTATACPLGSLAPPEGGGGEGPFYLFCVGTTKPRTRERCLPGFFNAPHLLLQMVPSVSLELTEKRFTTFFIKFIPSLPPDS